VKVLLPEYCLSLLNDVAGREGALCTPVDTPSLFQPCDTEVLVRKGMNELPLSPDLFPEGKTAPSLRPDVTDLLRSTALPL
jgi:hypothetical protein